MRNSSRCVFAVAAMLLTFSASSQIFNKSRGIFDKSNKKMIQQVLDKTTTVYITGKGAYADRMKQSFTDYWTVNKVEFGNATTTVEPNAGVFKPVVIMTINGRGNETSQNYPFFVYGQADKTGDIMMSTIIAAAPINMYYEFDVIADTNMYHRSMLRMPYMVKTINDMLTYVKLHGDDRGYSDTIEARASRIKNKTLIIPEDLVKEWDINPSQTALIKADFSKGRKPMKKVMYNFLDSEDISYAGKYKVMTNEEIMQLEKSADADKYVLFFPAIADKKYLEVYDLKTKELLYFEEVMMSVKIKSKDFERLNKAISN